MANVAQAYVTVVPKFTGFKSAVEAELSKTTQTANANGQNLGKAFSQGATGGLAKSGALVGAFSAITTTALSSISEHLGSAISRFDTLNNYPTVMQALGYSAESSQNSIQKMSDRLSTLPTTLNDMASTVQGIAAVTGDLDLATDAGLALNDMLLASGSSTQLTTAAMEQFRQMLSKGKPDMQDWKSLVSAMPGQMNQLAQAMLGPTANANDLYTALGGGGGEAIISMDELMAKMIELDTTGTDAFTSFKDQAETASGGVATSMANMQNAITKGIAGVMDEIGKDTIAGVFNDMKSAINTAFSSIKTVVGAVKPVISGLYDTFKSLAPSIITATTAFVGLKGAMSLGSSVSSGVTSSLKKLTEAFSLAKGGAGSLKEAMGAVGLSFSPVSLAIAGISTAIGVLAPLISDFVTKQQNAQKATTALSDAMKTANFDMYATSMSQVSGATQSTVLSLDELNEKIVKTGESINQRNADTQSQITTLQTAKNILNEYAGVTDLSTQAQGQLAWAIKEFNDATGNSITQADVATGSYTNQEGAVVSLKNSVNDLITAKQNELKLSAMQDNYSELLTAQQDATDALADKYNKRNEEIEKYKRQIDTANAMHKRMLTDEQLLAQATEKWNSEVAELEETYNNTTSALSECEQQMGFTAQASEESADALDKWVVSMDDISQSMINQKSSTANFAEDLHTLGVSAEEMGSLTKEELQNVAQAYDGTATSISNALKDMGKEFGNLSDETIASAQSIADSLNSMDGIAEAFDTAGVNVNDFALKLAEAGVSAETLNEVGSENLAQLAESCDGNMQQMVGVLQMYNAEPLIDKDGNVNVDDVQLIDAQGNVYTWNGSSLIDHYGNAAVEDTTVVDAQGHKLAWNGESLQYYSADGTVYDFMSDGIRQKDEWNSTGLRSWTGTGTINIFKNLTETVSSIFHNARGGIRPHADGGIRYHAGGAIATRAIPLDIVGEAGAEAIVPLTNERYSKPFATLIANIIKDKLIGEVDSIRVSASASKNNSEQSEIDKLTAWLASNLGSIISSYAPHTVIDNDAGALIVDNRLAQLQRKAGMNVGY